MFKNNYKIRIVKPEWKDEAYEAARGVVDFYERNRPHKRWAGKDYKKDKYQDTYKGLLGQIAFRENLKEAVPVSLHSKLFFSTLYTENLSELPIWDAKVQDQTIDVKVISPDGDRPRNKMWVKQSEFKGLDWYVGIKLWSGEEYRYAGNVEYSLCGILSGPQVASSKIYHGPYADAYEIEARDLGVIKFTIDNQSVELK